MNRINTWTDAEVEYLRLSYRKMSFDAIGAVLGKTEMAVKAAAGRLGIAVSRKWSEQQLANLREFYPNSRGEDVAAMIGKPITSIWGMAKKLGIKKSEAFMSSEVSGRLSKVNAAERGGKSRFQKRQRSWNKGKKVGSRGRSAETQFRKGHTPHNALPVGSEIVSTDGYRKIKVAEPNGWEFVHRRNWEADNGRISAGKMIRFRDGDKMNCSVENLMLISRTEHALYNSQWNIPAEVVPAMAALAELKRELNNYAEE